MKSGQIILLIVLALTVSCSSNTAQPETPDEVQAGFEDFLKEKQQQDQIQEVAIPKPEERPESYEAPKTKLDINIPSSLKSKYGDKLTSCFEGYGSVEKIAALASYCVTNLASDNKDEALCIDLLAGEELDKCYQALAKAANDASYCEKISDDTVRNACVSVMSE